LFGRLTTDGKKKYRADNGKISAALIALGIAFLPIVCYNYY